MRESHWEKNLFDLIRRTSTDLPMDVEAALRRALRMERLGGRPRWVLSTILRNVELARKKDAPLCQDTGTLRFYFRVPVGFDTNALVAVVRAAVSKATRCGYLRQNTVDPVFGCSFPTNIAHGSPVFDFQQGGRKSVDVRLVMNGGGCENVGGQYALPDCDLAAGRNLEGARRCILDSVWKAQGQGCAPGVLGVCIGGDRVTGHEHAKEQFLRKIGDSSSIRAVARLESRMMKEIGQMGIGPMGLGGRSTVLGVKIGSLSCLPASFFVSVSHMCWAFRRRGMVLGPEGGVHRWLY
ncbi:MAG: fumarate hydratase [Verrucomicrobiota bacterium]|nr:fumarate hydratase [Verrucomicrobiota bacterium]